MAREVSIEIFAEFIVELQSYLPSIKKHIEDFAGDHARRESLGEAYRLTHTVKGATAMFGLPGASYIASFVENLLEDAINTERALSAQETDWANATIIHLDDYVSAIINGSTLPHTQLFSDVCAYHRLRDFTSEHDCAELEETHAKFMQDAALVGFETESLAASLAEIECAAPDTPDNYKTVIEDADAIEAESQEHHAFALSGADEKVSDVTGASIEFQMAENSAAAHEMESVPPELMEIFALEAEEHLRTMSAGFASFDSASANDANMREMMQDVRRSTHTLKGSAGVVGLLTVSKLAHRMEDLLDRIYDGERGLTREAVSLLMAGTDVLETLLHGHTRVVSSGLPVSDALREMQTRFTAFLAQEITQNVPAELSTQENSASEISTHDAPAFEFSTNEFATGKVTLPDAAMSEHTSDYAPFVEVANPSGTEEISYASIAQEIVAQHFAQVSTPQTISEVSRETEESIGAAAASSGALNVNSQYRMVRVPLARLDALVKSANELVINRTMIEQRLAELNHKVVELQENAVRLRDVSAKLESEYEIGALGNVQPLALTGAVNAPAFTNPAALRALVTSPSSLNAPAQLRSLSIEVGEFDELEFDRYTEFHVLSRQLDETSRDITASGGELEQLIESFDYALERQRRLTVDMQELLLRARMVPLASLAPRLQRTVRVVADQQNKFIDFHMQAENVELDSSMLHQLVDPLLHLLRNAVDHGIESPQVRRARGKAERGTIFLRAYQEGTQVVVEINDDGGGINGEAIRAAAIRAGLVASEEAAQMSDKEAWAYIFRPGFSTAREVSEISGRGVGMDVAKFVVSNLQGTLDVDSTPHVGTRFTIRLPLTLGVMRAVLIKARDARYAIPIYSVARVLRVKDEQIETVNGNSLLRVDDKTYTFAYIDESLDARRNTLRQRSSRLTVLLVRVGTEQIALAVDELTEEREIVVKSLGAHLRHLSDFIGATILGDGSIVPILNPRTIAQRVVANAGRISSSATEKRKATSSVVSTPTSQSISVLIVDDSPSVRRVMANLVNNANWQAHTAHDGLDALEQLTTLPTPPSIILLDLEMPRMNGYELLAALKDNAEYAHIPTVMITSRSGDKHRQRAFDLGISDYLTKPYTDDDLIALIRRLAVSGQ
ncbi:MAG: hypothetical protein NVSMB56_04910 [Pyrinomonadaceae bacterium]